MRVLLKDMVFIGALMASAVSAFGQAPPDRGSDRPPRPADAPPRGAPRDDEDRPPPPGKAGPRPRGEAPEQPRPGAFGGPGLPNPFQPPGRRGGGGFGGGYGAYGGGYAVPTPGGMPGMFPGEAADDPEMRGLMEQDVTLDRA